MFSKDLLQINKTQFEFFFISQGKIIILSKRLFSGFYCLGYRVMEWGWYLFIVSKHHYSHLSASFQYLEDWSQGPGWPQGRPGKRWWKGIKSSMELLSLSGYGESGINNGMFNLHSCILNFNWTRHYFSFKYGHGWLCL